MNLNHTDQIKELAKMLKLSTTNPTLYSTIAESDSLEDLRNINFEDVDMPDLLETKRPGTPIPNATLAILPRYCRLDYQPPYIMTVIAHPRETRMIIPNQAYTSEFARQLFSNIIARRTDDARTYGKRLLDSHRLHCFDTTKETMLFTINLHGLGTKFILPNGSSMLDPMFIDRDTTYRSIVAASQLLKYKNCVILDSSCANLEARTDLYKRSNLHDDNCITIIKKPTNAILESIKRLRPTLRACNHRMLPSCVITARNESQGFFFSYVSNNKDRHELDLTRMYTLARYYLSKEVSHVCNICAVNVINIAFEPFGLIATVKPVMYEMSDLTDMVLYCDENKRISSRSCKLPGDIQCPCGLHFCSFIE